MPSSAGARCKEERGLERTDGGEGDDQRVVIISKQPGSQWDYYYYFFPLCRLKKCRPPGHYSFLQLW
uniref:ATP synthase lipid-binding protein, mitochondrial n=1 Tax=Pan troglodytes TaxID=9598 RepID=G2HFG0_PANTR|nr:ATP synthase lipid-binding protein, mitochondrial precursor [Pan troglodytes]